MPYAPINVAAYTSAFAGAIAGMAVSGWIVDPTSADYNNATLVAGAFAQEFDTIWNNATALNNLEIEAITSVVQQDFTGRGPGPLNSAQFQNPLNWTVAAKACAALILQSDIFFAGQGINPGTPGGGGLLPVVSELVYVNQGGSDVTGNGTEENPFQTIAHAQSTILDASFAKAYGVLIGPGTYNEAVLLKDSVYLIGSDPLLVAFGTSVALGPTYTTVPGAASGITNVACNCPVTLDFNALSSTSADVNFRNCFISGNVLATAFDTPGGSACNLSLFNTQVFADFDAIGCQNRWFNSAQTGGGLFHLASQANNNSTFIGIGGGTDTSLSLETVAAAISTNIMNCYAFSMQAGVVTKIIGAGGTVPVANFDFGCLPENCTVQANGTMDRQMRISHQFPNVFPNPTAIGAAGTTTIDIVVPAALIGTTSIEVMQSQCSPVGSGWGTFIGPHNCSLTFTYEQAAGVPTIHINIYNPGAGFNIADICNLNFFSYLPQVL
ncbi:Uncharacterised protein [uncultured archaeon]|nr:Uncharacterised protein [uncultured archaeon]